MSRALHTAFACALMAALLAPAFSAHLDPGAHPLPFASTGLDDGAVGPHLETVDPVQGNGLDRVAGWYAGSASAWLQLAPGDPLHENLGGFCDLEVAGLGGGDPVDESVVDGSTAGGGLAPDGLWNDGGFGMACHTADAWDEPAYNTPGCDQYSDPTSPSFGNARAEDAIVGADVWIVTACDASFVFRGHHDPFLLGPLLQAVDCAVDEFLDATGTMGCVRELLDCLGILASPDGCGPAFGVICGADGLPDEINAGRGGGHAGPGVAFPPAASDFNGASCDAYAQASVFVVEAVVATFDPGTGTVTVHDSSTPTHGWIA